LKTTTPEVRTCNLMSAASHRTVGGEASCSPYSQSENLGGSEDFSHCAEKSVIRCDQGSDVEFSEKLNTD
jgi:hypothetical protein